ncbi:peptidoglycan DD-metalloendopeptidase family protein [Bacillus luti]
MKRGGILGKLFLELAKFATKGLKGDKKSQVSLEVKLIGIFCIFIILMIMLMVTNLQKTLCSIPLVNKADFCQEDYRPIPDEEIEKITDAMKSIRDKAVASAPGGMGEKFEKRKSKHKDAEINDAEVYLRALMNLDMAVLHDAEVNEENIKKGVYKDTNVEKLWKVVEAMKKSDDYKDIQEKAKKGKWIEKDWMQYAQLRVYTCYLVGDNVAMDDDKYLAIVKNWFGQGRQPCEELDKLYGGKYINGEEAYETKKLPNGKELKLIDHGDIGVIKQTRKIYDYYEFCEPKEPPAQQGGGTTNGGGPQIQVPTVGIPDLVKPPVIPPVGPQSILKGLSAMGEGKVYAATKDEIKVTENPCKENEVKKDKITEREELAYLTKMEIVDGFADYSLFQKTEHGPVPKKEKDYKVKLEETINEIYEEIVGVPVSGMGGLFNGWLIPMEEGTYYLSSPFGPRPELGDFHWGIDLGSLGQKVVPFYAAADGVVEKAHASSASPVGADGSFDRFSVGCEGSIVILHPNGWRTKYCHMNRENILVKTGWKVKQGQILGATGNGGGVAPHLDFKMCPPGGSWESCSGSAQIDPLAHPETKLQVNKDRGNVKSDLVLKRIKEFNDLKSKISGLGNKTEEEVTKLLISSSPMQPVAGNGAGGGNNATASDTGNYPTTNASAWETYEVTGYYGFNDAMQGGFCPAVTCEAIGFDFSQAINYKGYRIIATDPRKIPMWSIVEINAASYNLHIQAIALDTGGAIKGNKIDILWRNKKEAYDFGRRKDVQARVLRVGKGDNQYPQKPPQGSPVAAGT